MGDLHCEVTVEQEDDERVYRLLVNGEAVCTARTLDSILLTIGTITRETDVQNSLIRFGGD